MLAKRGKSNRKKEEEMYFSSSEIIAWEKKHSKTNGKYVEALHASINNQISVKIFLIYPLLVYAETKTLKNKGSVCSFEMLR